MKVDTMDGITEEERTFTLKMEACLDLSTSHSPCSKPDFRSDQNPPDPR
jgi:hypothetical protein